MSVQTCDVLALIGAPKLAAAGVLPAVLTLASRRQHGRPTLAPPRLNADSAGGDDGR